MTERPILFTGPMVRALLDGRKTQTRRAVKPQPEWLPEVTSTRRTEGFFWPIGSLGQQCGAPIVRCPYGVLGDQLWVKENFRLPAQFDGNRPANVKENVKCWWEADGEPQTAGSPYGKLRPSIYMPLARSRLSLRVTDVRVERLNEIDDGDAMAEGIGLARKVGWCVESDGESFATPRAAYRALWESINGPGSWDANPWVWVVSFEVVK